MYASVHVVSKLGKILQNKSVLLWTLNSERSKIKTIRFCVTIAASLLLYMYKYAI